MDIHSGKYAHVVTSSHSLCSAHACELKSLSTSRLSRVVHYYTSIKNHFKGDTGMANYEKQVEQEAAYPIPISLYNCYRTVRHEKRYQEYIAMLASLSCNSCTKI